jgi:large subunit ribosomal protein L23
MSSDPRLIIKSHLLTERSTKLRDENNEYVFEVERTATKYTIKRAVEAAFKVKVDSVRTLMVPGKMRRIRRDPGKTAAWKKAIVRLKKGESIAMFENV